MAYYAALLSTIELLDDILHPLRFPNSFSKYDTPTFNSLHKKFIQLQDSLQDCSSTGREADPMEARIRDASYQVLDLIESQIPEHQQVSLGRFDWKEELQKVGEEVDSIVQRITAIKQSQTNEHVAAFVSEKQQPLVERGNRDTKTMVGFEEQALTIREHLCGSSHQLQVIPIVGMGGIGKTTLAAHTFHDPLIVSQFDFRGWVTVSQDYDVIRVLYDLINSLGITVTLPCELSEGQDKARVIERKRNEEIALKRGIHKYLKWRKFLIIIDDVWITKVWDDIMHAFPNDCNGSRIVLTTRLADVAEYAACTDSIHHMQFLDADASWTLLQAKAFAKDPCPSELDRIGKAISSKCSGLPIAIVVIGGILSNCKTLHYWENVAEDVGSILSENYEKLSNILSLSYNHLPHHLKPCFLHMGSFPEDCEINISKLVKLWSAEGFLNTNSKSKCSKEIGDDYLEDLVRRNLVIITKKRASGEFKSCMMHDVLRDFCRQKGLDEHFFHVMDRNGRLEVKNSLEKIRRIFVNSPDPFRSWGNGGNGKYVRSIYQSSKIPVYITVEHSKNDNANLSRVFEAARLTTPFYPSPIPKMSHLKYLFVRPVYGMDHCIDPIVSNLQNLQTLAIYSYNSKVVSLPSEIWKMMWLEYLIVHPVMRLPQIPPNASLQKLEYLHTLQTVKDFKFTNEVTQMIPNLRNLKVMYENERDVIDIWEFYGLYNLHNLLQLEKLNLYIVLYTGPQFDLVKSGFGFPQNLKKLTLRGCKLPWESMTLVGSLKCLQVLKLRRGSFVGEVWEPVEGEFLQLKLLLLEYLHDLNQWRAESRHFPKLQHLKIINCLHLEEIPLDIGEIGPLKSITVINSQLAEVSAKKIQEEQQELGNYELQVEYHRICAFPFSVMTLYFSYYNTYRTIRI